MNHKTISIFLGALALTLTAFLLTPSLAIGEVGDLPVRGWAWSSNVGWISLHTPQDDEDAPAYGVSKTADGSLVGHAWNNNIGWIKFGGLSDFPSGPGTSASNAKISGDKVIGWARALTGAAGASQGWDGWISLSGTGYGVHHADGVLSSDKSGNSHKAWGPMLGWIGFNATIDGTETLAVNCEAQATDDNLVVPTSVTWEVTSVSNGTGPYNLTWSADGVSERTVSNLTSFPWSSLSVNYTTAGNKTATFNLTDSGGRVGTCNANIELQSDPEPAELSIQCLGDGSYNTTPGANINVGAKATGGVPTYTFRWYEPRNTSSSNWKGSTSDIDSDDPTFIPRSYSTVATYLGLIQVTDFDGVTDSCNYVVTVTDEEEPGDEFSLVIEGDSNMYIDGHLPNLYSAWSVTEGDLSLFVRNDGVEAVRNIKIISPELDAINFKSDKPPYCVTQIGDSDTPDNQPCDDVQVTLNPDEILKLRIAVPEPESRADLRSASPMTITIGNDVVSVPASLFYSAPNWDIE